MTEKPPQGKRRAMSDTILATVHDSMAAFLEDFSNHMAVGDRMGAAVAAAKVAQMGLSTFELFDSGSGSLCITDEETARCHEAAIVVRNYMEANLEAWYAESRTDDEKRRLSLN